MSFAKGPYHYRLAQKQVYSYITSLLYTSTIIIFSFYSVNHFIIFTAIPSVHFSIILKLFSENPFFNAAKIPVIVAHALDKVYIEKRQGGDSCI